MLFRITQQDKPVGTVELLPDRFELQAFSNKGQERLFDNVLRAFYELGISDGMDKDARREEALKPDDPRFVVELGYRLQALGYQLT